MEEGANRLSKRVTHRGVFRDCFSGALRPKCFRDGYWHLLISCQKLVQKCLLSFQCKNSDIIEKIVLKE